MTISRTEARKIMDSLSKEFMSVARCFEENGVNCISITNSQEDWRDLAVAVSTKGPVSETLKQEVEACAEKALGRKLQRGDLFFQPPRV